MKDKLKKIKTAEQKSKLYQWLFYVRINFIWYFVLKHFKLQQPNIISFFLFFAQSYADVFHLPELPET